MKKLLSVCAIGLSAALLAACGPGTGPSTQTGATDIAVFAGGSSEFSWTAGTREAEVIDYIEQVYYEDTGTLLNFRVNTELGKSMKQNIFTDVQNGNVDVVISHTSGGDGVDDWAMDNDLYYDLYDYIDEYLYEYAEDGLFTWEGGGLSLDGIQRLTTESENVIGLPSVISPYKFGILVRKDWMEACGYTDDPEDTSKTYVGDFQTFTAMAKAMKERYSLSHVITGAMFDVEKAGVLGAYGINAGYYTNTVYQENGKTYVGPGYIHPDYADVLQLEYEWSRDGILSPDCDNILLERGENNFIAGNTGIFLQDPTVTHLIEVARRTKQANPEAEFTVLGALTATPETTEKGFMRNSTATFAAVIPRNSKNAREVIRFVRWMYSDVDNYLLCKYGREGIDWVYDREKGTYNWLDENGEVSDAGYINPPYSGILTFVENQNMANLTYAGYTVEELSWIATAQDPENYISNDTIDYLLYLGNRDLNTIKGNQAVAIAQTIRPIWNGNTSYEGIVSQRFDTAHAQYMTNAESYLVAMAELYNNFKN